jgi:hypothetical protein
MASYSEMKTGLDDISGIIRDNRAVLVKAKSNGSLASTELASIPTDFAAVIAAIDAIPANTTNTAEMLLKAEKAKLATEFTALKAKADAIAAVDLSA